MGASQELQKLCESWWEKLSNSTKIEQQRFAEQFLVLLGWDSPSHVELKGAQHLVPTTSYILRGGGETALAAHFVMPGSLEPPSKMVERSLDFCEATRVLVEQTRAMNVSYTFISDLFRSYLYDVRTQELLLFADSPAAFKAEMAPVLVRTHIEGGSLEELRRQPRSFIARQLREWCQRWIQTIMAESGTTEDIATLVIDRLVVLRFLFDYDILKRPGWRLHGRLTNLIGIASSSNPRGCGKGLTALLHDIWFDWKADIFAPVPILDAVLERDHLAASLLLEYSLLSRMKFTMPAILESFNFGDAAEKARVRMIPEEDADRNAYLYKQTSETVDQVRLEVDLEDEGYRAIMHWFDKLCALFQRLEYDFNAQTAEPQCADAAMDLFEWSEIDAKRPQALSDRFHFAIEKGLRVYYTTARQQRTSRLLLYLHLILRYDQSKMRFTQFPSVDDALTPRPKFLKNDRDRIMQPWQRTRG
jgi:hypothetical protein